MTGPAVVSARSRASLAAIDRTVVHSSDEAGWTSLLVERHTVALDCRTEDIPPTPDQKIVVGVRGAQRIDVRSSGGWRQATYRAGTVGLTAGGRGETVRRRSASSGRTFEKINLYVPDMTVQRVLEDCRGAGVRSSAGLDDLSAQDPVVETFAHAVLRAVGLGAPDLYAETAALWLVTHLAVERAGTSTDQQSRRPARMREADLARVVELVRTEFASPLPLDRLATEARMSKHHFVRLFREATGVTPHSYVIGVRLDNARVLLEAGDLSVGQVARRCGYERPSHFAAAYALRFGVTPSDERRRSRGRAAVSSQRRTGLSASSEFFS